MIYTITLNPAIDKTVMIDDFGVDKVNRINKIQLDPGGKGINVSKMIQNLGGHSTAIMIAGGHSGDLLTDMLDDMNITYETIKCDGETRTNIKVCDMEKGTFTDINEPGPEVGIAILNTIDTYLERVLKPGDILSLSGSLPKGTPKDIYQRWCNMARVRGVKVLLDADGEVLKKGTKGKPFLIKPNQEELEHSFNFKFTKDEHVIYYAKRIIESGVSYVVVSQGEDGCILVSRDHSAKINPIRVNVKSTVGAGDSMVAAIAYCLDSNQDEDIDFDKMYRYVAYGVAASSASIEQDGTIMGSKERIEDFYQQLTAVK